MDQPNALIKNAVFEAMRYIADGKTPTEALEKTAKFHDLNSNYIQRVGEVMNVTLHYNHFKTAEDRAATFPIADIPATIEKIYGTKEKTANEYNSLTFTKTAGSVKDLRLNSMLHDGEYKKAYLKIVNSDERNDSFPMTLKGVMNKAAGYLSKLAQENDRAATAYAGANRNLSTSFNKVLSKFARAIESRIPFNEFESQVYSLFGEKAVPFVDELYKHANLQHNDARDSRGVHDAKYVMFVPSTETNAFVEFMKSAEELLATKQAAEDAEYNLKFEREYYDQLFFKEAKEKEESKSEPLAEPKEHEKKEEPKPVDPVIEKIKAQVKQAEETPEKKAEEPAASEATGEKVAGAGFGMIEKLFEHFKGGASKKDTGNPLTKHTNTDNVTRKTIIEELIMTDPILSKADVRKVISAYEQLLRVAPMVTLQKEMVRSQLRAMVQGQGMSPYDGNQLAETDLNLMRRQLLLQDKGKEEKKG